MPATPRRVDDTAGQWSIRDHATGRNPADAISAGRRAGLFCGRLRSRAENRTVGLRSRRVYLNVSALSPRDCVSLYQAVRDRGSLGEQPAAPGGRCRPSLSGCADDGSEAIPVRRPAYLWIPGQCFGKRTSPTTMLRASACTPCISAKCPNPARLRGRLVAVLTSRQLDFFGHAAEHLDCPACFKKYRRILRDDLGRSRKVITVGGRLG